MRRFKSFPRKIAGIACCAAAVLLSGCTETFDVTVDAIHDPKETGGHSYRIEPVDPMLAEKDLNYARAVKLVQTALSAKGMYEAPNPDEAEVVVGVDYGLGSPRTEIRSVDPLMQMPGSMAGVGVPMRRGTGLGPYPGTGVGSQIIDEGGTLEARRVYEKYLSIVARKAEPENPNRKRGTEIWRVDVTVEDEKQDIGRVLPVMAGAAADYIGVDTGNEQKIRVNEKAEVVEFVRQGP